MTQEELRSAIMMLAFPRRKGKSIREAMDKIMEMVKTYHYAECQRYVNEIQDRQDAAMMKGFNVEDFIQNIDNFDRRYARPQSPSLNDIAHMGPATHFNKIDKIIPERLPNGTTVKITSGWDARRKEVAGKAFTVIGSIRSTDGGWNYKLNTDDVAVQWQFYYCLEVVSLPFEMTKIELLTPENYNEYIAGIDPIPFEDSRPADSPIGDHSI